MPQDWRKSAIILLVALLPSLYFLMTYGDMPHLGHFHDDGVYLGSAQSIAEGNSFRLASAPGEPFQTRFPPLFSAFLSLAFLGGGLNLPLLTKMLWLLLPVFLLVLWRWYQTAGVAPTRGAILCALVAVNVYGALFSISAMSELFACSLVMAALLFVDTDKIWLAAIFAGLAYLTRSALVALGAGIVLYLLYKRRFRHAAIFVAILAPFVVWWNWWVATHGNPNATGAAVFYTNYVGFYKENVTLSTLPGIMWKNLAMLFQSAGALIYFNTASSEFDVHLGRLLTFGAIAGVVRLAKKNGLNAYHCFAVVYAVGLLTWNYVPHERLVFPLFPLLLAGLANELTHFFEMLRGSYAKQKGAAIAIGGVASLALLFIAWTNFDAIRLYMPGLLERYRGEAPVRRQAYDWIRANTPENAKFLAYDDPTLHLYTGRHGYGMHFPTRFYYADDRKSIVSFFASAPEIAKREGLDYLLQTPNDFEQDLDGEERPVVAKAIESHPVLEKVHQIGPVVVWRIKKDATAQTSTAQNTAK